MAATAEPGFRLGNLPLMAVSSGMRLVRWAAMVIALILIAASLFTNFGSTRGIIPPVTSAVFEARTVIMNTLGDRLRPFLPAQLSDRERTSWVLIALALLTAGAARRVASGSRHWMFKRDINAKVSTLLAETGLKAGSSVTKELEDKVKAFQSGSDSDRSQLLSIFAETKRKLESMGRELSFLSIDVVGSTAMKEQEDVATAQIDFAEYRKLVERVFSVNGVIKSTWTPDGVMACFSTLDAAVKAGQGVIRELDAFNRDVKLMKTPFVVRCGVNSGFIYIDDKTPLEQVSDRTIDIAGHMQKYAEPSTVAVAKNIIKPLTDVAGFSPSDKVVDGHEVYVWRSGT